MVRPHGNDAVFHLCDFGTLEDQPATLAECVLRSVFSSGQQSTGRRGRLPPVEPVTNSPVRIAGCNVRQHGRQFVLNSNANNLPNSGQRLPNPHTESAPHFPSRCAIYPTPSANIYAAYFPHSPSLTFFEVASFDAGNVHTWKNTGIYHSPKRQRGIYGNAA